MYNRDIRLLNYNEHDGDNISYGIDKVEILNIQNHLNNLPKTIICLVLEEIAFKKLNKTINNLGSKIKTLYISHNKTLKNMNLNNLPRSLECFRFAHEYSFINIKIPNILKNLLIYNHNFMCFNNNFNNDLNKLQSKTIKITSHHFNRKIDYISDKVMHLDLRCFDFNEKIDNISLNLLKLDLFCEHFIQEIDNLPHKLSNLFLRCDKFNKKLDNLPLNLLELSLHFDNFNKKLNNICCEYLLISNKNKLDLTKSKIIELTSLCEKPLFDFPNTLKKLSLRYNKEENLDMLPEGLETLVLHNINKKINDLPSSIKEIKIYKNKKELINTMYWHKIKFF